MGIEWDVWLDLWLSWCQSLIYLCFMRLVSIIIIGNGVCKPTSTTGGHHIVESANPIIVGIEWDITSS